MTFAVFFYILFPRKVAQTGQNDRQTEGQTVKQTGGYLNNFNKLPPTGAQRGHPFGGKQNKCFSSTKAPS